MTSREVVDKLKYAIEGIVGLSNPDLNDQSGIYADSANSALEDAVDSLVEFMCEKLIDRLRKMKRGG